MARRISLPLLLLLVGSFTFSLGCERGEGTREEADILTTEEVGGPIDAELSTEEDPRGRRRSESGRVLPPGFPADLPLPAGVDVVETAATGGENVVMLDSATPPEDLTAGWSSLLETEGWIVERGGALSLTATRGEQSVSASIFRSGSGSRLRIVY